MAITSADIRRIKQMARKKRNYTEWYGMKRALLTYGGLPSFFPLKAHLQHGAGMIYRNGKPDPSVLKTPYQDIFLCNNYQKNICARYLTDKDIYVVGSIFPLYRQHQGIVQNENAEGTLFFTAHSTESIQAYDDIDETLTVLNDLPDYLKPIKVSIYYTDLLKGLNKVYEDHGYETFTNGHRNDRRFVDNLYQMLKSVKYAAGTAFGSQTYYSVEMGIPYFIIGSSPEHVNQGNGYFPEGTLRTKDWVKYGYKEHVAARSLFALNNLTGKIGITEEQKSFVLQNIGSHDKISRKHLRKVIVRSAIYAGA